MAGDAEPLRLRSPRGRRVVGATVAGSGVAMLTGTVVNVALPTIGRDLEGSVADLQWIVNGYLLTLSALILLGGALGDRFGRRRIFLAGTVGFTVASVLCAVAPTTTTLIAARLLQGVAGALLTPGSLAIIQSSFHRDDRPTAIGAWSGLGGIAAAIGPPLGGWIVEEVGWRWVFVAPIPLAVVTLWLGIRSIPETRGDGDRPLDVAGSILATAALAGIMAAVIGVPERGWSPLMVTSLVVGIAAGSGLIARVRTAKTPLVPPQLFASKTFVGANLVTLTVYAALGGVFFLLVVHLQTVAGYSATGAGLALLPITAILLVGSPAAGLLAKRLGPRIPLMIGPLVLAVGMLMMGGIPADAAYSSQVLPAMVVFGLGITTIVAPVTAAALAAADDADSGLASAVNNAVARVAQLLAVAALPAIGGLSGGAYQDPDAFAAGFERAMWVAAMLALAGSLAAWTTIDTDLLEDDDDHPTPPSCPSESTPAYGEG